MMGILFLAVFSWFINTYILQSSASTEPLDVSMTATQDQVQLLGNTPQEFNVAFTIANHDVVGMSLILMYDSRYLQYGKEYGETGIVQPKVNTRFETLEEKVEEIDDKTKQVTLILVSLEPPSDSSGRLLNFRFRAVNGDDRSAEKATQKITLQSNSEFVGSYKGQATSFSMPTEPVSVSVDIETIPQILNPTVQKRPIEIPKGWEDKRQDIQIQKRESESAD